MSHVDQYVADALHRLLNKSVLRSPEDRQLIEKELREAWDLGYDEGRCDELERVAKEAVAKASEYFDMEPKELGLKGY